MTSSTLVVRSHPACLKHIAPLGFPESPARLREVLKALKPAENESWEMCMEAVLPPPDDIIGVLRWFHSDTYIEKVQAACQAGGTLDTPDCPVGPGTWDAALAAAGLALSTALDLVNERVQRAFLAVRPLAHHCSFEGTRGFGVFNHVALAAEAIVRAWVRPVLIVDFDAMHGNGTQSLFYDRPDVGFVSVHQYPFFPGSGGADEVGDGDGIGSNVNVPLVAGSGDDVFVAAFEQAIEALAAQIQPAAVIVSAGFSAHVDDSISGMEVTDEGLIRVTESVVRVAHRWAGGRILSFLEGGFEPQTLARNVRNHVQTLAQSADESNVLH
ncbi:MAG: histone deacetylase [bacterium]|nr:histone deacetylase [bacterium]